MPCLCGTRDRTWDFVHVRLILCELSYLYALEGHFRRKSSGKLPKAGWGLNPYGNFGRPVWLTGNKAGTCDIIVSGQEVPGWSRVEVRTK